MKKYIAIIAALTALVSCNDEFLDRMPEDTLTDANFWQTEAHVRSVAYSFTSSFMGKDWLNKTEIQADCNPWAVTTAWRTIGGGNLATDIPQLNSAWKNAYYCIGRTNYFLNNYTRAKSVKPEVLERFAAEAYFYRAFNYWVLTEFWGDVPYITSELNIESPDVFKGRDPKAEIIKNITKDLEDHLGALPEYIPAASAEFGHVSQAAAYALLSRIYLCNEMWDDAIRTAEKVMGSPYHKLYSTGHPDEDYFNLFNYTGRASRNADNKEVLLAQVFNYDLGQSARTSHNLTGEVWVDNDYARWVPTNSMIESYLKTDGTIWNPKTCNSYEEVFENRDPRMKQSIMSPGTKWNAGNSGDLLSTDKSIFTYPKFDNSKDGCMTYSGYYTRKYAEISTSYYVGHDDNDIVMFRLGEVLLNYAEAHFMKGDLTQDDLDKSINLLRDRVGMVHLTFANIPAGSDMLSEIRRERKVELFFEGMRPFDLKRWKMGEVFGQDLLGVNKRWIDQSRTRVQLNTLTWKTVNGESYLLIEEGRKFDPKKNYLFPIPFAQMQLNPNLKPQNPGWN